MNVYFISGLGADRRAFERLTLPPQHTAQYLDWIPPLPNEPLSAYARRLAKGIDTSTPFAVVGLSMGGMMASALANEIAPHKTVLLSSVGCNREFPRLLRFALRTQAHRWLPGFVYRPKNLYLIQRLMGTKGKGQQALLKYFLQTADPVFVKWAVNAIVNWEMTERPPGLYQIHGSKDKMFPLDCTHPDRVVPGGTHFMVWTKAQEVSKLLAEALED